MTTATRAPWLSLVGACAADRPVGARATGVTGTFVVVAVALVLGAAVPVGQSATPRSSPIESVSHSGTRPRRRGDGHRSGVDRDVDGVWTGRDPCSGGMARSSTTGHSVSMIAGSGSSTSSPSNARTVRGLLEVESVGRGFRMVTGDAVDVVRTRRRPARRSSSRCSCSVRSRPP